MNTELYKKREPDQIDLIQECHKVLFKHGLGKQSESVFLTDPDIVQALEIHAEGQRYFVNRFWLLQLMSLVDVNTMNERWCLVPNGEIKDWLRLFEDTIVPTLITHQLPKTLS
jgi:hypothetical protein